MARRNKSFWTKRNEPSKIDYSHVYFLHSLSSNQELSGDALVTLSSSVLTKQTQMLRSLRNTTQFDDHFQKSIEWCTFEFGHGVWIIYTWVILWKYYIREGVCLNTYVSCSLYETNHTKYVPSIATFWYHLGTYR